MASSSVELIFELMSFMKEPVEFSELEATWMLLGIVVDTNNFVYRASSTTFEVASTSLQAIPILRVTLTTLEVNKILISSRIVKLDLINFSKCSWSVIKS